MFKIDVLSPDKKSPAVLSPSKQRKHPLSPGEDTGVLPVAGTSEPAACKSLYILQQVLFGHMISQLLHIMLKFGMLICGIHFFAAEGLIRGRSYNIRLDDQVLLRFSPKNSDSTYYFSDMVK